MNHDQTELYNVSAHFPEKEAEMREMLENKQEEMKNNRRGWVINNQKIAAENLEKNYKASGLVPPRLLT